MVFQPNKFIGADLNDVDRNALLEYVDGMVSTYLGTLSRVDRYPVVIRSDVSPENYDKVAVISGGGSCHEPSHAGFVGEGLLTAAICGSSCAAPDVDDILAGIRAVTGRAGCLLTVLNYSDYRLNFTLAAEEARSEGYGVELLMVGDDCSRAHPGDDSDRRGLAGIILVNKIAGAAALEALSLAEVVSIANKASKMVRTLGLGISGGNYPGASDLVEPVKIQMGIGLYGDPSADVIDMQPFDDVLSCVLKKILLEGTNVAETHGCSVVLMINGLGSTTFMELMTAAGKTVTKLHVEHEVVVSRVYTGFFLTSVNVDMSGFSVTIMWADQSTLNYLDTPTTAPNWPVGTRGERSSAKASVPFRQHRLLSAEEIAELRRQKNILKRHKLKRRKLKMRRRLKSRCRPKRREK